MVSYNTMLQTFKADLKDHEKFKRDMIVKLAKQLEKEAEVQTNEINDKLSIDLQGYVTRQWIGQCLEDRYKDKSKAHKKEKEKEKEIEIATDGSEIIPEPSQRDIENEREREIEAAQHAEFHQEFDKALGERTAESVNLNDAVVKELDKQIEYTKELERKLQTSIQPEQFKDMEQKIILYEDIFDGLKNHIGEYVVYDKDYNIREVLSEKPKGKNQIKLSIRKFEDAIKESFKAMKPFAFIEHDGIVATDWK